MTGLGGIFRRLTIGLAGFVALFALLLGLSWIGALAALARLDAHVSRYAGAEHMPPVDMPTVLSGSLFVAAQFFHLRQPGAEHVRPGAEFRDCPTCPEMVVVPPGYYLMGSPLSEVERFDVVFLPRSLRHRVGHSMREGPRRLVLIDEPIAMSKYEVSVAQWRSAQSHPDWETITGLPPRIPDLGEDYGPTRPMTRIDWTDAAAYAAFVAALTGQPYRLPSEAEWEYAARAGSAGRYPWGEEPGLNNAACIGCSENWDSERPGPVGLHPPNGFGVHDMQGNAFEWVRDCFYPWHPKQRSDGSAVEQSDCPFRTVRGGSTQDGPSSARSALRVGPHFYNNGEGTAIRLARDMHENTADAEHD